MKFKPFILSLAVLTAFTFSACDGVKESSQPTETTSSTTSVPSSTEEIEYNGTFNEDIFNQICQNIKVDGRTISIPCTLADLGEDYSYNMDNPVIDEKHGMSFYGLLYKDEEIGTVTLKYNSNDSNVDDDCIKGLSFYSRENNGVYIAGITTNDTEESVTAALGQPTKTNDKDNDQKKVMYYKIADDKYAQFQTDNGKIIQISLQLPVDDVAE